MDMRRNGRRLPADIHNHEMKRERETVDDAVDGKGDKADETKEDDNDVGNVVIIEREIACSSNL